MTTQEATVVCDSIGEHSPRLTTFRVRQFRFIHSEFLRHRMLSFSAGSSRAVPVSKLLEEVRRDDLRAAPVWWGREQKGMQSGDELTDDPDSLPGNFGLLSDPDFDRMAREVGPRKAAQAIWAAANKIASYFAADLTALGVHKSIVNRLIEPGSHINVVATGVEDAWLNFFGLRLDKAAQPEMRDLAEKMWAAWNESEPEKLRPGEWHLPFVDNETMEECCGPEEQLSYDDPEWLEICIKVSAARCARTSYTSFETGKRSTVEEDLRLYEKLVGSTPMHAGPLEHQATPDRWDSMSDKWEAPRWHGNLPGWRQYRKMISGERIAPLPEGYRYRKPSW